MNVRRCLLAFGLIACPIVIFGQLSTQRDIVTTPKSAYVLLPPQFVCGPRITEKIWSSDGNHLAVLRKVSNEASIDLASLISATPSESTDGEDQIVVWNTKSQKSSTVFRLKQSVGTIDEMAWVTGSSQLVIRAAINPTEDTKMSHISIFLVSTSGNVTHVLDSSDTTGLQIEPNPYRPQVAITQYPAASAAAPNSAPVERQAPVLRVFGVDGHLSPPCPLPTNQSSLFWAADGLPYVLSFERDSRSKVRKSVWYGLSASTGKLTSSTAPLGSSTRPVDAPELELMVMNFPSKVIGPKQGLEAPTVFVSSKQPKDTEIAIATTDGIKGQLSPLLNAISYESQGTVMVRPMSKISLEAFRLAKLEEEKAKLMSKAKQVALGLIICASDLDNAFLSNKGDWRAQLEPYLRNKDLMSGFEYTFGGGTLSNGTDPANTALGFATGPGGRAVAYADGHVQWVPNP